MTCSVVSEFQYKLFTVHSPSCHQRNSPKFYHCLSYFSYCSGEIQKYSYKSNFGEKGLISVHSSSVQIYHSGDVLAQELKVQVAWSQEAENSNCSYSISSRTQAQGMMLLFDTQLTQSRKFLTAIVDEYLRTWVES